VSDQGWADAALGMDITSFGFIAFVAAVVVAFHLVPSRGWRTAVLSLANAAFIATYINKPQQIIPLLAFLLLGYLAVRRRRSALAAAISIGAVLTIYVYLKRFSFLGNNYRLQHFVYLIVGLSYILFRVLHLVIDARGGDIGEPIKPLAFPNYTCNFLTFVSGPVQLYQDFARDYPALSDGTKDQLTNSLFAIRYSLSVFVHLCLNPGDARASLPRERSGVGRCGAWDGHNLVRLYCLCRGGGGRVSLGPVPGLAHGRTKLSERGFHCDLHQ
jgi:hypothetical protein